MAHFVECAAFMATGKTCLLPILADGMLVRDFALSVREAYGAPETCAVILCDGETGKPLRGMHWLLPNSAIQVKITDASAIGPVTKIHVKHTAISTETETDMDMDMDMDMETETETEKEKENREAVIVYLDGIITPDGNGIGGIFLPARTKSGDCPAILTFHFPSVQTTRENDLLLAEEACRYVRLRCGLNCIPKIYCASTHVIRSSLEKNDGKKQKYTAHWVDLNTTFITDIRKKAVASLFVL